MTTAKPRRQRAKQTAAADIPQSREAVNAAIAEIGNCTRALSRLETDMNSKIEAIKARFAEQAKPLNTKITGLTTGVATWCAAHRDELTDGGKRKTFKFTSGQVQWRLPPLSVKITGPDAVLAKLKELQLTRFIRTAEEINREALLADRAAVAGVAGISFSQREAFEVIPDEVALVAVAS